MRSSANSVMYLCVFRNEIHINESSAHRQLVTFIVVKVNIQFLIQSMIFYCLQRNIDPCIGSGVFCVIVMVVMEEMFVSSLDLNCAFLLFGGFVPSTPWWDMAYTPLCSFLLHRIITNKNYNRGWNKPTPIETKTTILSSGVYLKKMRQTFALFAFFQLQTNHDQLVEPNSLAHVSLI